jgi:hypothetical protein
LQRPFACRSKDTSQLGVTTLCRFLRRVAACGHAPRHRLRTCGLDRLAALIPAPSFLSSSLEGRSFRCHTQQLFIPVWLCATSLQAFTASLAPPFVNCTAAYDVLCTGYTCVAAGYYSPPDIASQRVRMCPRVSSTQLVMCWCFPASDYTNGCDSGVGAQCFIINVLAAKHHAVWQCHHRH